MTRALPAAQLEELVTQVKALDMDEVRKQIAEQTAIQQNPQALTKVRLEVANGNGVSGAAAKVGRFLRWQGYAAARLTNQKPYKTQATQIQYRAGYEAQAQLLQSQLLDSPELVQRNDINANVRLVLGRDMVNQLAHYEQKTSAVQVAVNAAERNTAVPQFF